MAETGPVRVCLLLGVLVACTSARPVEGMREQSPAPENAAAPAREEALPTVDPNDNLPNGWTNAIAWQSYDEGAAQSRAQNKPMVVVVHASWCSHCQNYKEIFRDPRVVQRARDFVMVLVDQDADAAAAARFQPDGRYVPRTFFVGPQGNIAPVQAAGRTGRYVHFYNERDPQDILSAMDRAEAALGS